MSGDLQSLEDENRRLREILGEMYTVFMDMHKVYGSTAVCWGGIGGAAMTSHCSWECDNHQAHHDENGRLRFLLGEAYRIAKGAAL